MRSSGQGLLVSNMPGVCCHPARPRVWSGLWSLVRGIRCPAFLAARAASRESVVMEPQAVRESVVLVKIPNFSINTTFAKKNPPPPLAI